jgi:hypothetical protein
MDNTSGQGKGSVVPEEVKGLSWGAFFWIWIWGLFNRVWMSLLVFIPVVGFFVPFVLLFKGREWAWQNKAWESAEHFNRVQRKWGIAALIFLGLGLAIVAGAMFLGVLDDGPGSPTQAQVNTPAKPVAAPVPRPAAPAAPAPAASTPKPEPVVAAEAPKAGATVATAPATIAVAAPVAAPAMASAPTSAAATAPAAERAPRVRRERPAQPLPIATAAVEPKVYAPKYNDLMTAVLRPDRQGVTELLDLGRWVDKPGTGGVTPLLAAVRNRDTPMAELLIARGANVNATASNGLTAMMIARANGDSMMTTLLQRSGAK